MGAISQLHQSEMKDLLMGLMRDVNSAGEPNDACGSTERTVGFRGLAEPV